MMRSLFSGVSGLKNHQTAMDVIGNNIANVNTIGFKASRVVFSDIFSQTMASSSAPGLNTGGVNARQVGLGVGINSIDLLFGVTGAESTGNVLDVMIEGDGFFIVRDSLAEGEELDTETYPLINGGGATSYTRAGHFRFDAAGNLTTADGQFVMGLRNEWDDDGVIDDPTACNLPEDANETEDYIDSLQIINIPNNSVFMEISINKAGEVVGVNAQNDKVVIARLAIAQFPNQQGLEKMGGNYYRETPNSGGVIFKNPGVDNAPDLNPATIEMSNVDLGQEFTKMITTQRGFQANSRIITVSDTMLEELVNLKR